jgi:hypothetical protein
VHGRRLTAWRASPSLFSYSAWMTASVAVTKAAASPGCWPASSSALRMASATSSSWGSERGRAP